MKMGLYYATSSQYNEKKCNKMDKNNILNTEEALSVWILTSK